MENVFVAQKLADLKLSKPDIPIPLRQYYAQCAEDLILVALLRALAEQQNLTLGCERYLEIGANHPVATNATYLAHIELGMTGVLVEANADLLGSLEQARPHDTIVHRAIHASDAPTADLFVSTQNELTSLSREFVEEWDDDAVSVCRVDTVAACRPNALLEEFFADKPPLFLSVDVEGIDLELLEDIDWTRWRPAVVQAEPSDHFLPGHSDAISALMARVGYVKIAKTDVNLIFLDGRLLQRHHLGTQTASGTDRDMTPDLALVSILMPTRDNPVMLRRALDSLRAQTYEAWSVTLVNDGGDAAALESLVDQMFGDDPRMHILHLETVQGRAQAITAALNACCGDYGLILDDTDTLAPEALHLLSDALGRQQAHHENLRGVAGRANRVHEQLVGRQIVTEHVEPQPLGPDTATGEAFPSEGFVSLEQMLLQDPIPGAAFLFDLQAARELGFTVPTAGPQAAEVEDWDFHLRFLQAHDIWAQPELLAFCHHDSNRLPAPSRRRQHEDTRLAVQKERNAQMRASLSQDASLHRVLALALEGRAALRNEALILEKHLEGLRHLIETKRLPRPKWRQKLSDAWVKARNKILRRT